MLRLRRAPVVERVLPLLALAPVLAAALLGCPPPPHDPVGTSNKPRVAPKPAVEAKTTNTPPKGLREGVTPLPGRFTSLGHAGGRWEYALLANDDGRAALEGKVTEAKVGAKLVMDHVERPSGDKGPTMVMEKREKGFDPEHGDWRYVVVGAAGNLVFDGKSERCWGCHDDAPVGRDHLFPVRE